MVAVRTASQKKGASGAPENIAGFESGSLDARSRVFDWMTPNPTSRIGIRTYATRVATACHYGDQDPSQKTKNSSDCCDCDSEE